MAEIGKEGTEGAMKALHVIERKPKEKVMGRKMGRPRREPMVDVQVKTSVSEVMMSQGGDVPVGVVSLDVDDHCSKVNFTLWDSDSRGVDINNEHERFVVANPKQQQD